MGKGLTKSQLRNLVMIYLFEDHGGDNCNGNTWKNLRDLKLVESGYTTDPRTYVQRCTKAGADIAKGQLNWRAEFMDEVDFKTREPLK